jgi:hypothetical protein
MKKALIIHKEVRLKSYFRKIKRGFTAHGSETSVSQREARLKSYFRKIKKAFTTHGGETSVSQREARVKSYFREIVSIFFVLFFTGCSNLPDYEVDSWKTLIDPAFDQERVVKFYTDQVKKVPEGSKEEILIYAKLQKALKKAGNNKAVDGKSAMLEGYIVPVDTDADKVSKFLFFPTQAACIHVPASPANQTIYVEVKKGEGVKLEDAYERIRVYGVLKLQETKVATGTASFVIKEAISRVVPTLN